MVEIEITGFQSIDHVALKTDGFTCLVGRSNLGKSAIVRAVKAALTGAVGTWFVRHDSTCARRLKGTKTCKCKTSVRIKTEGLDLLWEKGDAVNTYKVNGQSLSALERGFPEFLVSHGLAPVKLGDAMDLIHVSDQFSPPFLLRESGATIATLLSDVARLDAVNQASKLVEKDRREAISLRKVRDKDVLELKSKLMAFDGLDSAVVSLSATESSLERMTSTDTKVRLLDGYMTTLSVGKQEYLALAPVEKLVIPNGDKLQEAYALLTKVADFQTQVEEKGAALKTLLPVEKLVLPEVAPIQEKHASLTAVGTFQESLSECEAAQEALQGVSALAIPESAPLNESLASLRKVGGWVDQMQDYKSWFDIRKGLDAAVVPEVAPLVANASSLAQMTGFLDRYTALNKGIADLDRETALLQTELADLEKEADALGVCPTCIRPLGSGMERESHESHQLRLQD